MCRSAENFENKRLFAALLDGTGSTNCKIKLIRGSGVHFKIYTQEILYNEYKNELILMTKPLLNFALASEFIYIYYFISL